MRHFVIGFLLLSIAGRGSASTFEELAQAATAAREARDVASAIDKYSAAVQVNPEWQEGWWYLGTFLFGTKQFEPAETAFAKFVALAPTSAPGYAFKSLSEIQTGHYQESLADMNRSVELGIGSQRELADVLKTNRALLLARLGRYDEALRELVTFAAAGQSPMLLQSLGIAGLRRPLLPADIPVTETALFEDAGRALFLMFTGSPQDASQAFDLLGTRYGSTAGVHYLIGYFLFGRDPQQAAKEFTRELQIAPDNAEAMAMLAYTKLLHGEREQALPLAQAAAQLNGNSPNPQYVLGRVLLDSNSIPQALAALNKAVQLDPKNLESRIELAAAYAKAGRYEDGKRERAEALRLSAEGSGS